MDPTCVDPRMGDKPRLQTARTREELLVLLLMAEKQIKTLTDKITQLEQHIKNIEQSMEF